MEFFAKSQSTGITVHISDSSKGHRTLVLLHGYLETLYIWEQMRQSLKDIRTIAIDLPGHGLSGSDPQCNSMELCAQVVRDAMDICGVDTAFIGGHSMGGYVAQQFCKSYPDRADGLILFNSNPFADSDEKKRSRIDEISVIQGGGITGVASSMIPKMYCKDNLRRCDDKIMETVELCDTHDPAGIVSSIRGLAERPDYFDLLDGWKKPALFIYGDQDPFLSADKREKMQSYSSFQHLTVPQTAHNSFIEKESDVVDKLSTFVLC